MEDFNHSANFLSVTCTGHENIAISETQDRRGMWLQSSVDECHHSAKEQKRPTSIRGRKHQAEISPDAPLTLPLDIKIGIVEIENDVGRMRHHL